MECLDDNAASEFVSGSLVGSALSRAETHLAGCRDCRALVATLAAADLNDSNADTRKHERHSADSQAGARPTRTLAIGDRVGRYLVLSTLGTGGMGVVFSAYDPQLDRKIALKLLRANLGGTAKEARTRLKREAQAIAQLNHPNVVAVYDVGTTDDGDVYVAMEFVEGDTLTTWLRRWPRTWRDILEVFDQAGKGLMAAHSVGLLHRDFKPDNVLVGGDGRVRVSDFGLARSVLGPDEAVRPRPELTALEVSLTATGTVLGTPRYMPPEQLLGPDIDSRSDQFSFCVALYEALYGTHPLPGATSVTMLEKGERALPPPEGVRVPSGIAKAVQRGLEKERARRFPTMAALMSDLTPPPQRSPVRFVAIAVVALTLVGGATAAVVASRPTPIQRVEQPDNTNELVMMRKQIELLLLEKQKLVDRLIAVDTDLKQMQKLKEEIVALNQEIEDLSTELVKVQKEQIKIAQAKPPLPKQDAQVLAAIQAAQHDVEGCFLEWVERADAEHRPLAGDAALVVELSVTADGVGHSAKAKGVNSPSLTFCVETAIGRVHYPHGPMQLDLDVDVMWVGDGQQLNMTGRVVGQREASGRDLDLH